MVLIAHWPLDDNSIDIAASLVGTDTSITYVAGKVKRAAEFTPDDSQIAVETSAIYEDLFDGGGSVVFWIKTVSDGQGNLGYICATSNSSNTGWNIGATSESGSDYSLRFFIFFSGTNGSFIATDRPLVLNQFTHMAITLDADTAGNIPKIYKNGLSLDITESAASVGTRSSDTGEPLFIGDESQQTHTFDGLIDNLKFFNTILTQVEIQELYRLDLNLPASKGQREIATRWPITEGLIARTTRQVGLRSLHPEGRLGVKSLVYSREKHFLDNND